MRAIRRLLVAAVMLTALPSAAAPPTYRIDYVVTIRRKDPTKAHVRWLLAGIEEIAGFRLVFRDARTTGVSGTGRLVWEGRTLRWTPNGPTRISRTVDIDHHRPANGPRFDGTPTRSGPARAMFPEIVNPAGAEQARSQAGSSSLPRGWRSAAGERLGEDTYAVVELGKRSIGRAAGSCSDTSRGITTVAGMTVTVGSAPGVGIDPHRILRLMRAPCRSGRPARPAAAATPRREAPDPMWRGGLRAKTRSS